MNKFRQNCYIVRCAYTEVLFCIGEDFKVLSTAVKIGSDWPYQTITIRKNLVDFG